MIVTHFGLSGRGLTLAFLTIFLLLLPFALPPSAQAQAQPDMQALEAELEATLDALPDDGRLTPSEMGQALEQLLEVQTSLSEARARADTLRQRLAAMEEGDDERDAVQTQLEQVENQRRNLRDIFESIAIGGVDRSVFSEQVAEEDFNWQEELLSIMRPLFGELRQLTERPRMLERLRRDNAILQQRLTVVNQALSNIEAFAQADHDEDTDQRLEDLALIWRDRRADLMRQQGIVQLQLDSLTERDVTVWQQWQRAVQDFLLGRGLTLFIAIGAFALTLMLMQGSMNRWLRHRERKGIPRRGTRTRIFLLAYRIVVVMLSVMVLMMVLYAAGDLVLFSLVLLLIVALLFSLRTYVPRYLSEMRLFLNAGQVRERERVIYNGIPWLVKAIGFQSWLVNPELENGRIRLPLSELNNMISRPVKQDEPWFPCRRGEYVLLSDGTFGLVERQTPELVQLRILGAPAVYDTADFVAGRPRNLSRDGFLISVIFGIDYRHQALSPTEVAEIFRRKAEQKLIASPVAEWLTETIAEFREASDSSLDYQVMAVLKGGAAGNYFKITRLIQAACVEACNENDWIIPFNQLTIHKGEGFNAISVNPRSDSDK